MWKCFYEVFLHVKKNRNQAEHCFTLSSMLTHWLQSTPGVALCVLLGYIFWKESVTQLTSCLSLLLLFVPPQGFVGELKASFLHSSSQWHLLSLLGKILLQGSKKTPKNNRINILLELQHQYSSQFCNQHYKVFRNSLLQNSIKHNQTSFRLM